MRRRAESRRRPRFRNRASTPILVLALAFAHGGVSCRDDSGSEESSSVSDVRVLASAASALPGTDDDVVAIVFTGDLDPSSAEAKGGIAFESPPGSPISLVSASLAYDNGSRTLTIALGARANLVPGSPFEWRAPSLLDARGLPLDPQHARGAGIVGGSGSPPVLLAVAPAIGSTGGGTRVRLAGLGFTRSDDTAVTVEGQPAADVRVLHGERLSFLSPRGLPGSATIRVAGSNGAAEIAGAFVLAAPVPQVEAALLLFAGDLPSGVAIGDLDGDGFGDVVAANTNSNSITVFRSRGNGDFEPGLGIPSGAGPSRAQIADWNGDGFSDVLVTCGIAGAFAVHEGSGTLLPGAPRLESLPAFPEGFVAADFDGDGALDAAVASRIGARVTILFGDGTGGIAERFEIDPGLARPGDVAAGDFDRDGALDLVVSNDSTPGAVALLFGDGSRAFARRKDSPDVALAAVASGVDGGDVDGDGLLDVAVSQRTGASSAVLIGRGDGTFEAPRPVGAGTGGSDVLLRDANGDGALDVLTVAGGSTDLRVRYGDGAGGFPVEDVVPVGETPTQLAAGDVNGDGRLDVAVADSVCYCVSVALNGPDRRLLSPRRGPSSAEPLTAPVAIAAIDRDGDGDAEIAVVDSGARAIRVLDRSAAGGLDVVASLDLPGPASGAIAADFTGDGRPDLLVADSAPPALRLFPGEDGGGFGEALVSTVPRAPTRLLAADFDGDGDADAGALLESTREILLARGDGAGRFADFNRVATGGGAPRDLVAADFDGDGFVDLATAETSGVAGHIALFRNDGDLSFAFERTLALSIAPARAAAGDVDRDGLPDVLAAGDLLPSTLAEVFRNEGVFRFERAGAAPVGGQPTGLAIVDFDRDGYPDLVAQSRLTFSLALYRGRGDGTFSPLSFHSCGKTPTSFVVADVDGDGSIDFVTLASGSREVVWIRNRG